MKYEWKKEEKSLYGVKEQPALLHVPVQNYITLKGTGDPNGEPFAQRVGVLYSLAYQLKMSYKANCAQGKCPPSDITDFAVFPLEGVWTSTSENPLEKDCYIYTIMIKQPGFITKEMFETALKAVEKKKPHPFLKEAAFETFEDGECVQMLHKGPFDDEPASFAKMEVFLKENGYERLNCYHREIYLSDARKTAPEKKRTILRLQIRKL